MSSFLQNKMPSFEKLFTLVIVVHVISLTVASLYSFYQPIPPIRQKIAIRTVKMKPAPKEIAAVVPKPKVIQAKKVTKPKPKPKPKKKKSVARKPLPALPTVGQISELKLETETAPNYTEELVALLQGRLRLPEHGDVETSISVQRSGKIKKVEILKCDNEINEKYVRESLPAVMLPPFGTNFSGSQEYTFHVTFTSER